MRPTRSTAAAAVVASVVALAVSYSPRLWGQAATQAPAPAPSTEAPRSEAPSVASAPAANPNPPPAPSPTPAPAPAPTLAPAPPPGTGPADSVGPLAGANVTVFLRADAVGTHFPGSNIEPRNLAQRRGTFVRCDRDWFVLKNESQEIWIPRAAIALVEMRS